jgi:hypothetical protein
MNKTRTMTKRDSSTAHADHFTGVKWEEKASACSVRDDSVWGVAKLEMFGRAEWWACGGDERERGNIGWNLANRQDRNTIGAVFRGKKELPVEGVPRGNPAAFLFYNKA